MPVIGITGGVASGKSTFRKLLQERITAECFDADACAKELLDRDLNVRQRVIADVHPAAYGESGIADRRLIREVVYSDEKRRRALEDILHPLIRERWTRRATELKGTEVVYLVDIPLLFETRAESFFDRILTVACSRNSQMARLTSVRGLSVDIAEKIIASQLPMSVKVFRSHHVVWNDGAPDKLSAQTEIFARYFNDRYG